MFVTYIYIYIKGNICTHAPSTAKDTKIVILSYITTKYNFLFVFLSALFLFLSTQDTNQIRC
jgi:hypothetical protein